jgi:hypothetical protein
LSLYPKAIFSAVTAGLVAALQLQKRRVRKGKQGVSMQPRRLGGYTIAGKCFFARYSDYFAPIMNKNYSNCEEYK